MRLARLALVSTLAVACRFGYEQLDVQRSPNTDGASGGDTSTGGPPTNGGAAASAAIAGDSTASGGDPSTSAGASTFGGDPSTAGGTNTSGGTSGSGGTAGTTSAGSGGAAPGCDRQTYQAHDYVFCSTPLNQADATSSCAGLGMQLVRIDDVDEMTWLRTLCFAGIGTNNSASLWPWIGANDLAVAGEWRWPDGTQFWQGSQTGSAVDARYSNWAKGQPSTNNGCVAMQNNATTSIWTTMVCSSTRPYTCETL